MNERDIPRLSNTELSDFVAKGMEDLGPFKERMDKYTEERAKGDFVGRCVIVGSVTDKGMEDLEYLCRNLSVLFAEGARRLLLVPRVESKEARRE